MFSFFFNVLTSLKKIKYFLYVMTRSLESSPQHSYLYVGSPSFYGHCCVNWDWLDGYWILPGVL